MNSCPHCNSQLRDFWWETQLPQAKWTKEQASMTAAKQAAMQAWRNYHGKEQELQRSLNTNQSSKLYGRYEP